MYSRYKSKFLDFRINKNVPNLYLYKKNDLIKTCYELSKTLTDHKIRMIDAIGLHILGFTSNMDTNKWWNFEKYLSIFGVDPRGY